MENRLLVNIKLKGKIFGCGKEVDRYNPNYIVVENDKEKLIGLLNKITESLESIDENDEDFWMI